MVGEDGASRLPCVRTLQMAVPDLVNLSALIEDAKCFALVRQHRWPEGVHCPACGSATVVRDGFDETQRTGSGIGARHARDASTTSPARCWPGITSRCGSGCCALLHGPEPLEPADRPG